MAVHKVSLPPRTARGAFAAAAPYIYIYIYIQNNVCRYIYIYIYTKIISSRMWCLRVWSSIMIVVKAVVDLIVVMHVNISSIIVKLKATSTIIKHHIRNHHIPEL